MEIRIVAQNKEYVVYSEEPVSFFDAMELAGLSFYRPCGGRGRCLRCGIQFIYGASEINEYDDEAYDRKELNAGYRIGCKCVITRDCKIEVPDAIVADIEGHTVDIDGDGEPENKIGVAVDIGTTTVAVAVVNLENKKVVATASSANAQIKYGSDVMSRIQAAIAGESEKLTACIRDNIIDLIGGVTSDLSNLEDLVVVGNTTMNHFFLGYPLDGLGAFPFTPYSLEAVVAHRDGRAYHTLPGASAFVGSDIIAGIYSLGITSSTERSIFLDLGTNAEVALWDGKKLWATSSSAGPALEGGNISCGVPSIKGAISHVQITPSRMAAIETIGGENPIGVCGSGIIDLIYEMRKANIISSGGLFTGPVDSYAVAPGITVTADDIQQVLLAKSAIYSSIIVLLEKAGLSTADISKLYVAGGLGAAVSPASCAKIGLIPKEMEAIFTPVGNTALQGAVDFLLNLEDEAALNEIVEKTEVLELANCDQFQKLFLENLKLY